MEGTCAERLLSFPPDHPPRGLEAAPSKVPPRTFVRASALGPECRTGALGHTPSRECRAEAQLVASL